MNEITFIQGVDVHFERLIVEKSFLSIVIFIIGVVNIGKTLEVYRIEIKCILIFYKSSKNDNFVDSTIIIN